MKSPCLSCDLKDHSKDNQVCKECDERVQYVNSIDGIELPDQDMRIRKKASLGKLKKAESYIQSVCDQYHIDLSDFKSRKFGGNLRETRRQVANTLRYDHGLSMKDIGKLLNKTQQAVSVILNPKEVKPTSKNLNNKPISNKDNKVESKASHTSNVKDYIYVCFKDRPELFKQLIESAEKNFRTPDGQALYLICEGLNANG